METKVIIRIALYNLILSSLILLDLALPEKQNTVSELNSIYGFTANISSSRKPIFDSKIILELSNGERYRIARFPDKEYKTGTKIILLKSTLFDNVNHIKVYDNGWKKINIGLFSNSFITFFYIAIVLISILNLFIKSKISTICLIASMMSITILSFVYFVYF